MMIAVVALKSLKSFNTCAKLYKKRLRGRLISPPKIQLPIAGIKSYLGIYIY